MLAKLSGNRQQLRSLGAALTPEQALINILISNISGIEIIDMGAADVYLTADQSRKAIFAFTDCGDGTKKVYYHPDAVGSIPVQQAVITLFSDNHFTFGFEGGQEADCYPDDLIVETFCLSQLGSMNDRNKFLPKQAVGIYYEELDYPDLLQDLDHGHAGSMIKATNAAAAVITMISGTADTTIRPRLHGWIVCEGLGGLTLQAPVGTVLNGVDAGAFVMTQYQIAEWFYDKVNDIYRVK